MGPGQGLPGRHRDGRHRLRRPPRPRHQGDGPRPRLLRRRTAGRDDRPHPLHHRRPRRTPEGRPDHRTGGRRPDGRPCPRVRRGRQRRGGDRHPPRHPQGPGDRAGVGARLHHRGEGRLRAAPADRAGRRRHRRRRGVRAGGGGLQRRRHGLADARGRRHRADRRFGRGGRPARRPHGRARPAPRRRRARPGEGRLGTRVPEEGPTELRSAATAFNSMADQVVQLLANERELAADLSHRLRTPLTVLRLNAASLGEGPRPNRPGRPSSSWSGRSTRSSGPPANSARRPRGRAAGRGPAATSPR